MQLVKYAGYVIDSDLYGKGKVTLEEEYYLETETKPRIRKIRLLLPGPGLVFKLDHVQKNEEPRKKKNPKDKKKMKPQNKKPPLFHFLDDNAKPWSKRCDFVIFYVNRRMFHADCIEFKSKSLSADKILPQLRAGVSWVKALKRIIEYYTGDKRKIHLRKFVFAENENPYPYIDNNRQLNADPSIRYYHFDEVQDQPLIDLKNTSVQDI